MFEKLWNEVSRLHSINARHVRGYGLAEMTDDLIISRAEDEFDELDEDRTMEEMGDLLAILFHYCKKHNWTPDRIEESQLKKLKERFPTAYGEKL